MGLHVAKQLGYKTQLSCMDGPGIFAKGKWFLYFNHKHKTERSIFLLPQRNAQSYQGLPLFYAGLFFVFHRY